MASTTLLNATGDFTLEWDEGRADAMEQWIDKKMKAGFSFFVVERKLFGLVKKKTAITSSDDLKERSVKISDDDMVRLASGDQDLVAILEKGVAMPSQNPDKGSSIKTVRRAKTPREAARNHTVGVRPIMGG